MRLARIEKMNQNLQIKRISKNIWKIVRTKNELENRPSFFIKDVCDSSLDARFNVLVNEDNLVEFYVDDKLVLNENSTEHSLSFKIGEKDSIYGLGLHQFKPMNRRNTNIAMVQYNGRSTAVPFFTSNGGYAVLIDTTSYMSVGVDRECIDEFDEDFDEGKPSLNNINLYVEDSDELTYYVILGSFEEQMAGYRYLTGKGTMLPKWAYGFFQCKEHYHTQDEILGIAHRFREDHLPIDCIVQDWNYWGDLGWNAVRWDEKQYPNPKAMVDEIHSLDMKLMVSCWPSFGAETEVAKELMAINGAIVKKDGHVEKWGRIYDAYNPVACDVVWNNMKKYIFDLGADAWWLDSTEPGADVDECSHLRDSLPCHLGTNIRYLNSYGLASARNIYEHQRRDCKDKRVYILTRSGYAGQQESAISTWTGDIGASWNCLERQINSLLSFSMSGIPYSTTDIGGFFVDDYEGGCENPEYRELYTRWYWFGLFCPLFRSHGTTTPREIWNFGKPGEEYYDSILKASKIRYALMPHIYSYAYDVYKNDKLFIRPLIMDYPTEDKVKDYSNGFMFTDNLYVVNITEYKQREIDVYLPKGNAWFDLYTSERYEGGQTIKAKCPIDQIPAYVKGGSILLTTDPAEATCYQNNERIDVRIYSGNDASTFYYDDNGDNYDYEHEDNLIIGIEYDDSTKSLTIDEPVGNTSFRLPKVFRVYLDGKLVKDVEYASKKVTINL